MFTVDTILRVENATSFRFNYAEINGHSLYRIGGVARYVLPAPLGHYVQDAALCDPQALCGTKSALHCAMMLAGGNSGCDMEHAGLHLSPLPATVDHITYPPPCSCAHAPPEGTLSHSTLLPRARVESQMTTYRVSYRIASRIARRAGYAGYTTNPAEQSSPSCSGECPAGVSCEQGTSLPVLCTKGSYCQQGSPLPVPYAHDMQYPKLHMRQR